MAGKETSAGRVLLIPKGVFTSGTNYTPLDFVAFGSNNYVCKKATDGTKTPVEDTASWQMLAAGFDSHNIAAQYREEATYHAGDICISGGNLYKAKQDIDVAEAFTAGHWEEITIGNELTAIETGLASKAAASDVTTLEEKVGTTALTTTATDLSGAVNEVKAATDTNASAITQLNSELGKLTLSNSDKGTDLSKYNKVENAYVFPCDGYVHVTSNEATSGKIRVAIRSSGGYNIASIYMNITDSYQENSVFVKKGMIAFILMNSANSASAKVTFYALVN